MNGHNRPTVDDATWFDLQVRCLEQLRTLLQYLEKEEDRHPDLFLYTRNLIQALILSMDANARKP